MSNQNKNQNQNQNKLLQYTFLKSYSDKIKQMKEGKNNSLGQDYSYYRFIQSPDQLGITTKGTLKSLDTDINGLLNYVQLLVDGTGKASSTGKPLGNKYFFKTGTKCIDSSNIEQDRYIYIDNVPSGQVNYIKQGMGQNFSSFKGLIPGIMDNLDSINPNSLMNAFMEDSEPKCQQINMEVIDNRNQSSNESHYVTLVDIKNLDPCSFQNGINPITKKKCKQPMTTMNSVKDFNSNNYNHFIENDPFVQFYFFGISIIGIYLLYNLMIKQK